MIYIREVWDQSLLAKFARASRLRTKKTVEHKNPDSGMNRLQASAQRSWYGSPLSGSRASYESDIIRLGDDRLLENPNSSFLYLETGATDQKEMRSKDESTIIHEC